jgi:hypothetical protein
MALLYDIRPNAGLSAAPGRGNQYRYICYDCINPATGNHLNLRDSVRAFDLSNSSKYQQLNFEINT